MDAFWQAAVMGKKLQGLWRLRLQIQILHPTQIYSGFLDFAHFLLLLYVAKHKKADGQVAACYLIFYSIGRFVIEFFRGDIERGSVGVLSTSQFISIFTTVAGIILLLTVVKKQKQEANISLNSKG